MVMFYNFHFFLVLLVALILVPVIGVKYMRQTKKVHCNSNSAK